MRTAIQILALSVALVANAHGQLDFSGGPPEVVINSANPRLSEPVYHATWPSLLSIAHRTAITSEVIEREFWQNTGRLRIWDLSRGKIAHTLEMPGRITGLFHAPVPGYIVVGGGPLGKDQSRPFLYLIDIRTGQVVKDIPLQLEWGFYMRQTADRRWVILNPQGENDYFGCDLSGQDPKWARANEADWKAAVQKRPVIPPSWIVEFGAYDAGFMLADDGSGLGLWRTDIWEKVQELGRRWEPYESHVCSLDGKRLAAWTAGGTGGLTVWDLEELRVHTIQEEGFLPALMPVFSADGDWLRYARMTGPGQVEIISRNWKTAEFSTLPWLPAPAPDPEIPLEAVFSDNGQFAYLGEGNRPVLVSWDPGNGAKATVKALPTRLPRPILLHDAGKHLWYAHETSDEERRFSARCHDFAQGRTVAEMKVDEEALHTPSYNGAFLGNGNGLESVMAYRVTGASLGHYIAGLYQVSPDGKAAPVPGIKPLSGWNAEYLRINGATDHHIAFYKNIGDFLMIKGADGAVTHRYQWEDHNPKLRGRGRYPIMNRIIAREGGRVFLPLNNGGIRIVEPRKDGSVSVLGELWGLPDNGWFAVSPDGHYAMSVGSEDYVSFRKGQELYPFEQFDAFLNRPGKVLESLRGNPRRIEILEGAYQKRRARLGLDKQAGDPANPAPAVRLLSDRPLFFDEDKFRLKVQASGTGAGVERILVHNNDVPINGTNGAPAGINGKESREFELEVPLIPGRNKIQVWARDRAGVDSIKDNILVHRRSLSRPPDLYLLAIGVSDYADDRADLRYPSKDAGDLSRIFEKFGQRFGKIHKSVLVDGDATRQGILDSRSFLKQSQPQDLVVAFIAGHGVLDEFNDYYFCPHDFDAEDYAKAGVSFAELESLFSDVPAQRRLLLMDTCHSGEVDSEEMDALLAANTGARSGDAARAVAITPRAAFGFGRRAAGDSGATRGYSEALFADLQRGLGLTILSASGGLEFALENEDWKNGAFTYCVIDGLQSGSADLDRNEAILASELIRHVSDRVVELTGGSQNPNARSANLAIDFPVLPPPAGRQEDPREIVRRYLDWSSNRLGSGDSDTQLDRAIEMFAPKVRYFGKTLTPAEIRKDAEEYNQKYYNRDYRVDQFVKVAPDPESGEQIVSYDMSYEVSFADKSKGGLVSFRRGKLESEMRMKWNGAEWKITALGNR